MLSRDVACYFDVTDPNRSSSAVDAGADIRALAVDLKDSQVHIFVRGRKVIQASPNKKKAASDEKCAPDEEGASDKKGVANKKDAAIKTGVLDIFTQGKEVLENGLFGSWKNRTGKLGTDVFGCDAEYRHQHEAVVGEHGPGGGEDASEDEETALGEGAPEDEEAVLVESDANTDLEIEFDAGEDLAIENEI